MSRQRNRSFAIRAKAFRAGEARARSRAKTLCDQIDRWLGLSKALAKRLPDRRDPDRIEHSLESMLRQRGENRAFVVAGGHRRVDMPKIISRHAPHQILAFDGFPVGALCA
jgi:hypothetical protein